MASALSAVLPINLVAGKARKEVSRVLRLVPFQGSNIDPVGELGKLGFTPTSGFRTQRHQDALREQGLTQTKIGSHPIGDALDFMPPSGMSTKDAMRLIGQKYPGVRMAPSNKGAIHVTFPRWGKAPDVSGSRRRYGV